MSPKGLPDRWLDYKAMGELIRDTRFICMKVPLKPSLLQSVPDDCKFSCENAIDMMSMKGRKIGLVIDLTFTKRYYDPTSFKNENILYKKIFMPGRVIPKRALMHDFYDAIDSFEENNRHNDDVILVHCTHGLNRTGYMVCKYLVERKGVKPEIAIKAFEKARGHKMERELYLCDLRGDTSPNPEGNSTNVWRKTENYIHNDQIQFGAYNTDRHDPYRRKERQSVYRHDHHRSYNHIPPRNLQYTRPTVYYPHEHLRGPVRSYHSHNRYDPYYGRSSRNHSNEYWSSASRHGGYFDDHSRVRSGYDDYSSTRHNRFPRR